MGKKLKNKDLAARLGMSGTVVSLVLNNKGDKHGIKKETQERVLNMAKQMGFFSTSVETVDKPSYPIEEKPGIFGMITSSLNDPFVIQTTPYLQSAFSSIGVGFSVISKDPDDQRYDRLISALRKIYSGLILLGDSADDNTIRTLKAIDYPFIVLEKNIKSLRLNTITTDNTAGASLVADHIAKLGYKNIIIVADTKSHLSITQETAELIGVINKTTGINQPEVIEINKAFSGDDNDFNRFEKLLRPPFRAEIIIVMNAALVYPMMRMFKRKNIRIPQDIALISMEDSIGFDLMFTPVTALRKKFAEISLKAANMVWSEVKNSGKGKYKRQVSISPELVVRNSCGTNV